MNLGILEPNSRKGGIMVLHTFDTLLSVEYTYKTCVKSATLLNHRILAPIFRKDCWVCCSASFESGNFCKVFGFGANFGFLVFTDHSNLIRELHDIENLLHIFLQFSTTFAYYCQEMKVIGFKYYETKSLYGGRQLKSSSRKKSFDVLFILLRLNGPARQHKKQQS